MRSNTVFFVLLCVAVVGVELGFHRWMAISDSASAAQIRDWYSSEDPYNRKHYNEGLITFVLPCIILGIAAGCFGFRWPTNWLTLVVVGISIGIVSLFLVCEHLGASGVHQVQHGVAQRNLFTGLVKTLVFCGTLTYFARVITVFCVDGRDITAESDK